MRDIRFRFIGILAFLVGFLILFSCDISNGTDQISRFDLLRDPVTIAIFVFLFAFVASEGIGFIFSSIVMFFWNFKGYSGILTTEFKRELDYLYNFRDNEQQIGDTRKKTFLDYYNKEFDTFFSYFWQPANTNIITWTARRWDFYFTNIVASWTIIGIIGLTTLFILINPLQTIKFSLNIYYVYLLGCFAVYIIILNHEAQRNKREAIQMMRLWLNDQGKSSIKNIFD